MSDAYIRGPVEARRSPFLELEQSDWDAMVAEIRSAFLGARDYAREGQGERIVFVSAAAAARPSAGAPPGGGAGAVQTPRGPVAAGALPAPGGPPNVVVPALEPDAQAVEAVVAFLLSDDARGVTGAVIAADGGFSITKQSTPSPLLDERT